MKTCSDRMHLLAYGQPAVIVAVVLQRESISYALALLI
jgi:hypothetical protein